MQRPSPSSARGTPAPLPGGSRSDAPAPAVSEAGAATTREKSLLGATVTAERAYVAPAAFAIRSAPRATRRPLWRPKPRRGARRFRPLAQLRPGSAAPRPLRRRRMQRQQRRLLTPRPPSPPLNRARPKPRRRATPYRAPPPCGLLGDARRASCRGRPPIR